MFRKNVFAGIIKKKLYNNLSFFFLTYSFKGNLSKANSFYNDSFFEFRKKNLNPKIKKYKYKDKIIIVHGNLIIDEKINFFDKKIFFNILESKKYEKMNGSFILFIYDIKKNELLIINDRFASYKLFYTYVNHIFIASSSFKLICELKKEFSTINLDQDSILEFIYFRQILGIDTFEKDCKFFESASTFHLKKDNTTKINKYWEPKYYKIKNSRSEYINQLSQKIERSVKLYTSDKKKYGLLLSGGLDSRCILGICQKKLSCFTIAPKKNNEFNIAGLLARSTKNKHFFLLNREDPLNSNEKLNNAIFHLGSSFNYSGFDLINFKKIINKNVETILTGLNFDLFFKALYLPKKNISFMGKNFLYKKLNNLNTDIVNQFIDEISFKLKTSNPFFIFKNKKEIFNFKEKIYYKINKIKDIGVSLNAKGYNLWEYFYYQNLSRNIIFSMMDSLSAFSDVRIPSLENDLFDLAINMPVKYKINGNLYNIVLNKLCPDLMEFDYSNTNVKAKYSLKKQNLIKIYTYFLKKLFNYKKYKQSPGWLDRSWIPQEHVLSNSKIILKKIKNLENSKVLQSIDAIDIKKVRTVIRDHTKNKKNNAELLNLFLTIDYSFN